MEPADFDRIKYNRAIRAFGMGVQNMPYLDQGRPLDLGQAPTETWTLGGAPLRDLLQGDVFTDGSCSKDGPPPWYRAGWAVVKVSRDGVVLAWARGVLGQQLPQSSPASENVAPLAAVLLSERVETAFSDFQGVIGLEQLPMQQLGHRKVIYAEVRVQTRGRAGPRFKVVKVPAHVDPDTCSDPEERYRALGNQRADEIAKAAALSQPGPSSAELEEWHQEVAFLAPLFAVRASRARALDSGGPNFRQEVPAQESGL